MRMSALALSVLCLAGAAQAQTTAEPVDVASLPSDEELTALLGGPSMTSDEAYRLGVLLFEAKRYEGAEHAWLRAHALDPKPTLLVAVADTRQRRDDEPGAVAMLERYLAERPDAPDRASIEARIATLLQTPATLIVRSDEAGQAILLDGKPVDQKTPAKLEVAPGAHVVVVVGDGQQVGEESFQVGYGERKELIFTTVIPSEVVAEQSAEAEAEKQKEDKTVSRAVWATSGIAAGALLAGTVLGFAALQKEQDYRNNPSKETADQGETLALFADVSFGIAALSAITALTLFLTTKNKKKREKAAARLRFESAGPGAQATLRF